MSTRIQNNKNTINILYILKNNKLYVLNVLYEVLCNIIGISFI